MEAGEVVAELWRRIQAREGGRIASGREYWMAESYVQPVGERIRWFEPM